ncbi:MAG TPA: DUF4157 domain-containing protein, partial [Kofleriaceae bacterium]|nr:DUF4157 domain-containing protein [Kofleriaceae bacterium]
MELPVRAPSLYPDQDLVDDVSADEPRLAPGKRTLTQSVIQARGLQGSAGRRAEDSWPGGAGGGQPLPDEVRAEMESAFGADFSAVRVHVGPQAASIGAEAYTRGTDIFFAPGTYDPASTAGRELIGHELTHVVQQGAGRVQATPQARGAGGVEINADAALEREADDAGARAARGQPVSVHRRGGGVQAKSSAELVAEAALSSAFEAGKAAFTTEAAEALATEAVQVSIEGKIRSAAEARAKKEAKTLAS